MTDTTPHINHEHPETTHEHETHLPDPHIPIDNDNGSSRHNAENAGLFEPFGTAESEVDLHRDFPSFWPDIPAIPDISPHASVWNFDSIVPIDYTSSLMDPWPNHHPDIPITSREESTQQQQIYTTSYVHYDYLLDLRQWAPLYFGSRAQSSSSLASSANTNVSHLGCGTNLGSRAYFDSDSNLDLVDLNSEAPETLTCSFSDSEKVPETLACSFPECDATFSGKYSRVQKIRMRHRPAVATEFPCEDDQCDMIYKRQDARLKHYRRRHPNLYSQDTPVRSDTNNNRVDCSVCDISFQRPADLRRHMRQHEVPNFACEVRDCEQKFHRLDRLRDHVRRKHKGEVIATDEGPLKFEIPQAEPSPDQASSYPCSSCDLTFERPSQLTQHQARKHVRRYKCNECEKAFHLNADLLRHKRTRHSPETLHGCPHEVCSMTFTRQDNLQRHIRRTHGTNDVAESLPVVPITTVKDKARADEDVSVEATHVKEQPVSTRPDETLHNASGTTSALEIYDHQHETVGNASVTMK
ncbi:hypothetical protein CC86DRAFT_358692 [Ophiobolus disseminans]|uniref:pH-response transcription factor pacC/RIM101 n=1 Tax=Ophiobolus disseminans TaxID=1469910 RepID=A0A6A6ZKT5_9PLEO|nr:hypothetical protein CC86DRAFT_358692 [Ophiobolus disseminans]